MCFEILKKLSTGFIRFRIAKLGLGKENGDTLLELDFKTGLYSDS